MQVSFLNNTKRTDFRNDFPLTNSSSSNLLISFETLYREEVERQQELRESMRKEYLQDRQESYTEIRDDKNVESHSTSNLSNNEMKGKKQSQNTKQSDGQQEESDMKKKTVSSKLRKKTGSTHTKDSEISANHSTTGQEYIQVNTDAPNNRLSKAMNENNREKKVAGAQKDKALNQDSEKNGSAEKRFYFSMTGNSKTVSPDKNKRVHERKKVDANSKGKKARANSSKQAVLQEFAQKAKASSYVQPVLRANNDSASSKEFRMDFFLPQLASSQRQGLLSMPELLRSFRATVFPQIVQQASVLLNSQQEGNIRLVLHPRELGEVKILLKIEENDIVARIWVDNAKVKGIFEQNLKEFADALAEKGFEVGNLEVFIHDESESSQTYDEEENRHTGLLGGGEQQKMHTWDYEQLYATQLVNMLV